MGGRKQSPGGKEVMSAGCRNIWLHLATSGYSPCHFQFPTTSTAHLTFPKCAGSEMEDLKDAEKGRNVFGAMHGVH